jgi:D-3-phosphoglycerate dehydrogenase / 2-oxoglutarate reductase
MQIKRRAGQEDRVSTYRVVLTDQVFPDVALERQLLGEIDAELVIPSGGRDAVLAAAADADALLNTYLPLGADDIAGLQRCRIIARYGIGVDNIDLDAARAAGIVVTNVPDYCVEEVATHTLALILAALRRLPAGIERGATSSWSLDGLRPIPRLSELTFGIVGLGRIGRRVIDLIRPLGGRITGYDPYASGELDGVERIEDLDSLLAEADVVSLHLPVTAQTRGLIDAEKLALMRPTATLVNTSRGGLVRTADLADALRERRIAGAALDVLEREAADADQIAGLPGAIVTPHMAYYSEASLRESQRKATRQVIRVLTGDTAEYPVT